MAHQKIQSRVRNQNTSYLLLSDLWKHRDTKPTQVIEGGTLNNVSLLRRLHWEVSTLQAPGVLQQHVMMANGEKGYKGNVEVPEWKLPY